PARRRPRVTHERLRSVALRERRHAERFANHDRAPGYGRLPDRRERLRAEAHDPTALGLLADQKTGDIDEVYDRQMKRLREIDQPDGLAARVCGPRASVVVGIAGQHCHRPTIQAREPRDDRSAPGPADLEPRAAIEHTLEDRAHFVDASIFAR